MYRAEPRDVAPTLLDERGVILPEASTQIDHGRGEAGVILPEAITTIDARRPRAVDPPARPATPAPSSSSSEPRAIVTGPVLRPRTSRPWLPLLFPLLMLVAGLSSAGSARLTAGLAQVLRSALEQLERTP